MNIVMFSPNRLQNLVAIE